MDQWLTRPATNTDEPFLFEMLYEALFVPVGQPFFLRSVLDQPEIAHYVSDFGRHPADVGFVAETTQGVPIGAVWARRFTADNPGFGYIDDETPELSIAVAAHHRGTGIGANLLSRLLEEVPRVSLSVDEQNPAIRLYQRFGFEVVKRTKTSATMLRS